MRINQIQPADFAFRAKRNDYITKKMLEPTIKKAVNNDTFIKSASTLLPAAAVKELLDEFGITYYSVTDETIHSAAGYNGGFFSLKFDKTNPETIPTIFVQGLLKEGRSAFGGLLNYKEMTEDLKRQDIIQKGLQLHTYEMNPNTSLEMIYYASSKLSNLTKKTIKHDDLFFIGSEAFYYDKLEKTAYSLDVSQKKYEKKNPTLRICKFETDDRGNAVGYTTTAMNLFIRKPTETSYREQLSVSEELPEVADKNNNKLYAEAFRFGNAKNLYMNKDAISSVLKHLEERVKVSSPSSDMLQFVKLYDKQGNKVKRICYYDPTIGRSLVYDNEGKYLYQMEFNRDAFGNIIACGKY